MVAGCAASPETQAKRAEFERTIPICTEGVDCDIKWDAAQLWIVKNAGYKLQIATNVLLETYNPGYAKTELAVRVTKEPLGGGTYKLVVATWCDNLFGCNPDRLDAALDFNRTISAVKP